VVVDVRRHHTGSGHATVVPTDWESHTTVTVAGLMTEATVHLRRPGGTTTFNVSTGVTDVVPYVPFATFVPARITPISAAEVAVVEERAWILGYRVTVPVSVAPNPAQLDEGVEVVVVTCSDPMLVGDTLRVTDVVRGTHLLQRELVTELNS
jgi:hypothetical protein